MKKILFISFLVLITAGIIVYFSYEKWIESRIKYQFSEIINNDPESLYTYTFSDLSINIMSGSVDVSGISATPTKLAYDRLSNKKDKLRFLINFSLDEIQLEGFDISLFLTTGKISIKSLLVDSPGFDYYFNPEKKTPQETMPLDEIFNEKFKEATIGKLLIRNGEIKLDNHANHEDAIIIRDFNMKLEKARMDTQTLTQFTPFEYEDIKVYAAGIKVNAAEDFELNSGEMTFIVGRKSLEIRHFQLNPNFTQEKFSNRYNYQKQWIAVKLDRLEISGIDTEKFVNTGILDVEKINLKNPAVSLYKDKTKEEGPFVKKLLPASILKKIKWSIKADTILVENGFVSFDMTSNITKEDTRMIFTEIDGLVTNVTNDSMALLDNSNLTVKGRGLIFNTIDSELSMDFDLLSPTDQFTVSGKVNSFDAKELTPVMEPLAGVKLQGGRFKSVDFQFDADDEKSNGHLDAEYADLKIQVLNQDTTLKKKKKGVCIVHGKYHDQCQ